MVKLNYTPHAMKRGAIRKKTSRLVVAWLPTKLDDALNALVRKNDLDRSKVVRRALRNEISKLGIPMEAEE